MPLAKLRVILFCNRELSRAKMHKNYALSLRYTHRRGVEGLGSRTVARADDLAREAPFESAA